MEFVTVVVGIVLAFSLNNWNEDRKEKELAGQYLTGIRAEVESNLKEMEEKLEYHSDLLQQLGESPKKTVLRLRVPNVKSFAWEMADGNALKKHTEYDLYLKLLEIYQMQEKLNQHGTNASDLMSYLNAVGPLHLISANQENMEEIDFREMSRQGWIPIFEDMTTYEGMLIELYREALEEM